MSDTREMLTADDLVNRCLTAVKETTDAFHWRTEYRGNAVELVEIGRVSVERIFDAIRSLRGRFDLAHDARRSAPDEEQVVLVEAALRAKGGLYDGWRAMAERALEALHPATKSADEIVEAALKERDRLLKQFEGNDEAVVALDAMAHALAALKGHFALATPPPGSRKPEDAALYASSATYRSERMFPVLFGSDRKELLELGCPLSVPWSLLAPHEAQALKNHSQSLQRLSERGGLCPSEMVAILEERRWVTMPNNESVAKLKVLVG